MNLLLIAFNVKVAPIVYLGQPVILNQESAPYGNSHFCEVTMKFCVTFYRNHLISLFLLNLLENELDEPVFLVKLKTLVLVSKLIVDLKVSADM